MAKQGIARADSRRVREAVEQIRREWSQATAAMVRIGEIVLDVAFEGDAKRLLEAGARRDPTFAGIARKVEGLDIGIDEKSLSVLVRIAAWNQLVTGRHWKVLDAGRKEVLLPLADAKELQAGAKHAIEMGADEAALSTWVRGRLEALGRPVRERGQTLGSVARSAGHVAKSASEVSQRRIALGYARLGKRERKAVREQYARAREALAALEAVLDAVDRGEDPDEE